MRPKRRGQMPPPPPPAAANSGALPEELLLSILGLLDTNTLLSTAALVCKRWRELTLSTQLLHTVEARLPGAEAALVAQVEVFCNCLLHRAAPHVRRLRIVMPEQGPPQGLDGPDGEAIEHFDRIASELGAAFTRVGQHCQLEDLSISLRTEGMFLEVPVGGWAEALGRCLRRLRLDLEPASLATDARLQELTALEHLELASLVLEVPRELALPPALTRLHLGGYGEDFPGEELTPKLSALNRLCDLSLDSSHFPADGFASLGKLPALRRLHLANCKHPLPAPLAALTSLRTLAWVPQRRGGMQSAEAPPQPLPEGPYLRSLRCLAVPAVMAAASLPALGAAAQLQALGLFAFF
ncbi:hypothetical protein ABPG75_005075 [Micractinium tetrahymenae]